MQKILITGPEATGKSSLAAALADHFGATWVPEYARAYLHNRPGDYEEADLTQILLGQLRLELLNATAERLFCDTGPEVIHIWSAVKFGRVAPLIDRATRQARYDLALLCYPDLPWEPDPLREAPDPAVRLALFERYRILLDELGWEYRIIKGMGAERLATALTHLENLVVHPRSDDG